MTVRERFLMGVFLVLVLIVGLYYLVWPACQTYRSQSRSIRENMREIRRIQGKIQRLPRLRGDLRRLRSEVQPHISMITSETTRIDLLQDLRKLVRSVGIPDGRVTQFEQGRTRSVSSSRGKNVPLRVMEVRIRFTSIPWTFFPPLFRELYDFRPRVNYRVFQIQHDGSGKDHFDVQLRLEIMYSMKPLFEGASSG